MPIEACRRSPVPMVDHRARSAVDARQADVREPHGLSSGTPRIAAGGPARFHRVSRGLVGPIMRGRWR